MTRVTVDANVQKLFLNFTKPLGLDAMSKVESLLHNEPEFVGESRDADERLLIVEPLYD